MPLSRTRTTSPTPTPGGLAYWLLLVLGFSTLAPALLLPEWREYQEVRLAEQVEQKRAEAMERLVTRERRVLERLQNDPGVTARLAQRDLRYERAGQFRLVVAPEFSTAEAMLINAPDVLPAVEPNTPIVVEPITPPVWLMRWLRILPAYDYDRVFCDQETRPIILTMSVALIGLAFVLFGRRITAPGG